MKKHQVKVGTTYRVKVSGSVQDVSITGENPHGGWDGVNVATKRAVRIKSAQRLRGAIGSTAAKGAAAGPKDRLQTAEGSDLTDAINRATLDQLETALKHEGLGDKRRSRLAAALANRRAPKATQPTHPTRDATATHDGASSKKSAGSAVDATPARKRARGQRAGKGPRHSLANAAILVLAKAKGHMNAKAIVERATADGLYEPGKGKTPGATLYSAMLRDKKARFHKAERGVWALTDAGKAEVDAIRQAFAAK